MQRNPLYTILFATAVCVVCAIVVSSSAVSLKERQDLNAALEKQRNVLQAAGFLGPDEKIDAAEVEKRFEQIEMRVVDLESGEELPDIDPESFDQLKASKDPEQSQPAPPNNAGVKRVPYHALVYEVFDDSGSLEMVVLPIEGYGVWSTLYGFIALESDLTTIRGITFYQHGETPGLGGEVDNPNWKKKWVGRQAFADGEVEITVIKGQAGPPSEDPYEVDGLSGATITSRGVSNLVQFWLGEKGFGAFLENLTHERTAA